MIPLGMWFTRGPLGVASAAAAGAQWVWPADADRIRIFRQRCRGNDFWVEFGHSENPDPNLDTRDLP